MPGASGEKIKVGLVDDHHLVRHGIRALLELSGEFQVAFEAADGEAALAELARVQVAVLLLDVRMPRKSGLDVLRALRELPTPPVVLILTTFYNDADLIEAMRLGARGYLLKDVKLDQLVSSIHAVLGGARLIDTVSARVVEELEPVRPRPEDAPEPLTPRETEVLQLMTGGYSNREIAEALRVAEGTVKNHVSVILSKMGVRDRVRAVLAAIEHGLV
jgi:DNA-binding NarL/FixJ family response regulator